MAAAARRQCVYGQIVCVCLCGTLFLFARCFFGECFCVCVAKGLTRAGRTLIYPDALLELFIMDAHVLLSAAQHKTMKAARTDRRNWARCSHDTYWPICSQVCRSERELPNIYSAASIVYIRATRHHFAEGAWVSVFLSLLHNYPRRDR